jgi:putative flippase GtrA
MKFRRSDILQFVRYLVSGGLSFAGEYATFLVSYYCLHLAVLTANSAGFVIGLALNFSLNYLWVFQNQSEAVVRPMGQYVLLALVNLGMTSLALTVLNDLGANLALGKLAIMVVVTGWNFLIYKLFIFAK